MTGISAFRLALLAAVAVVAASCSAHVQDSSGRDYLKSHPELTASAATRAGQGDDFRRQLRAAAEVEPKLRFPARIGIARIEAGRLSTIPADESEAWQALAAKLGPQFGAFVPISPLIAEMTAAEQNLRSGNYEGRLADTIRKLRLGAARQHADAVLVYEVAGTANDSGTPLSIADLSIVGAFIVPSRHLKAEGFATALLLDVANGYPYGTASARAGDQNLVPNMGSTARTGDLLRATRTAAVVKLAGEVEKMAEAIYSKRSARPR